MADQSIDPDPFSEFTDFVARTEDAHIGHDIAGNPKEYIPLSALKGYWTPRRVSRVVRAVHGHLNVDIGIIRQNYLRVLSTLAYIGPNAVGNLPALFIRRNISDDRFPLRHQPSEWPNEKFYRDIFHDISAYQWQFFPLHFTRSQLQDCHLDDKCILPIDGLHQIAHSSAASIHKTAIHDEFNNLVPRDEHGCPSKRTFVVKAYHNKKYEDYYANELRALRGLNINPSPNVVEFYGAFQQLGSYCLILEYVDGGDLGEFFKNTPKPPTAEDVETFWKSLFQLFNGLGRIHELISYENDEVIRGIHEDIRPENILLMKGASGSHYDFTPKIADFGLHSRVRTAKEYGSGSVGLDHYGNQRFSSPECSHHTTQRQRGINMINTSADIFSTGAVLSHTVAWVIGGVRMQQNYFESRKAYHETYLTRFLGSGYEGCFHDSIEPLPIVAQEHRKFERHCDPCDKVTPFVLGLIEKHMLIRVPKDRWRAKDILERFEQFMMSPPAHHPPSPPMTSPTSKPLFTASSVTASSPVWSEGLASSRTNDPVPVTDASRLVSVDSEPTRRPPLLITVPPHDNHADGKAAGPPQLQRDDSRLTVDNASSSSRPPPSGTSPNTTPNPSPISSIGPSIFVPQMIDFHTASRAGKPVDPDTARLVEHLEHNLGGRDQLFFIDDSHGMSEHQGAIRDGFRALACIAKRLDPDKVELVFASRPWRVHRARRTRRLRELVEKCEYLGEPHLMEGRVAELIDRVIIPRLPLRVCGFNVNPLARHKVSVYIFTDGNWADARTPTGRSASTDDACGVETQVRRLIEKMKKRKLDRSEVSLHFVRFGDNENGRRYLQRLDDFGGAERWDIVDVKHIRSNVASMILGPLSRENDRIPGG
ncbi:hypothetical protein MFIFM68171_09661 [Madurella fahalii]|uniref:non-specific serine/threonine protein kinase n=1 Tax=Madurella fahalii TaxID=1157608 RepID=A0ABQ0GNY8_9PEZI